MGKSVSVRVDEDTVEALEAMQEDGKADSASEVMRSATTLYLSDRGYLELGKDSEQSGVAAAGELVGWSLGVVALAWLGVTVFYPVEARLPAVAALAAALSAFGIARIADGGAASVRRRVARVLGGGSA